MISPFRPIGMLRRALVALLMLAVVVGPLHWHVSSAEYASRRLAVMIDLDGPTDRSSGAPDAPMGACSICVLLKSAYNAHGLTVWSPNAGPESVSFYSQSPVPSNRPTDLFRPPIRAYAVS